VWGGRTSFSWRRSAAMNARLAHDFLSGRAAVLISVCASTVQRNRGEVLEGAVRGQSVRDSWRPGLISLLTGQMCGAQVLASTAVNTITIQQHSITTFFPSDPQHAQLFRTQQHTHRLAAGGTACYCLPRA
jgi:hypothetical protein